MGDPALDSREACARDVENQVTVVAGARTGGARSRDDVEDVVQETWADVFATWEKEHEALWLEDPVQFRRRLFTIARNTAIDRLRRRQRRREVPAPEDRETTEHDPGFLAQLKQFRRLYLACLDDLSSEERDVWIAWFHCGYDHAEISVRLSISAESSRKRKSRAESNLIECMKQKLGDPR